MIIKYYEKIRIFIKENYKILLLYLLIIAGMTYPLPYYIYNGGGTIDINDRVEIENGYTSKGSLNLAYVSELKATLPTLILSKIFSNWDVVKVEDMAISSKETSEDILLRDRLYLKESNQNAIELAYRKARKEFQITKVENVIAYIAEEANTNLKIGDIILSIEGQKINELEDMSQLIQQKEVGDRLSILVKRKDKEITTYAEVKSLEGKKMAGISFLIQYQYETDPKIAFHFSSSESGPSGGLMLTLSIYDKLVEEDITKGLKIVGTGTIDKDGKVGAIGGVKYKLKGAVKSKADVFVVPNEDNYQECIELQKKYGYKIKIIGVSTFEEVLQKLSSL